ncbi:MAG TPA: hypothetical protein VFG13_10405, partial [Blastococcus sp.]|nr:hypothetical protein [Blastococcus sp.]
MSTDAAPTVTPPVGVAGPALRPARTLVRYAVRHGLPAVLLERGARRGDLVGRLLRDPSVREDPYPLYEELRARGPVSPGSIGLVTPSHAIASEILRSDRFGVGWDRTQAPKLIRWALRFGDELDATGVAEPPSMLVVDPPDHTRFRRLVSRAFTPRATAAFEPVVQRTADSLLDALELRGGEVDLVGTYAAQLPVLVIADLLGVPTQRREDFLRWGAAAAATLDPGLSFRRYVAAERALRAMHAFLSEHFARLRQDPGEDLVSRAFTPRATARFEPAIAAIAGSLLDQLEDRAGSGGPVDLVAGYAAPLPVLVIAELLGVPTDRREDFLRWGAAAAATLDPGLSFRRYVAAERALRAMHAFLREHFARLRREPGEDLVSRLVGLP